MIGVRVPVPRGRGTTRRSRGHWPARTGRRSLRSETALRTRGHPRAADAGFTLVELLVAVAILSVVTTAIHASFGLGLKARQRSRDRLADLQSVRQLVGHLRDDLGNLAPGCPSTSCRPTSEVIRPGNGLAERRSVDPGNTGSYDGTRGTGTCSCTGDLCPSRNDVRILFSVAKDAKRAW